MSKRKKLQLVVLLGPTAVGKTSLAVELAIRLDGEIISADSRQIYRDMDIGSGKDLSEYNREGRKVKYHLIDILDAGDIYDIFQFQRDFYHHYQAIIERGKTPILCGGSGMYLQAALSEKQLLEVPVDREWRAQADLFSMEQLQEMLKKIKQDLHNTTDLLEKERLIRAIEIATFEKKYPPLDSPLGSYKIFGVQMERGMLRKRIKERLDHRLEEGMIKEVKGLIEKGISLDKLNYYGLEYRYISRFLSDQISYEEMYDQLLQEIRRFAKKQMTWFRRMEKQGYTIHWIDAAMKFEEKVEIILKEI